ncbi:MAG: iron ABC transporter permease [Solirubrobacteraceae bacterium]|nr:iron ABC transporter permease [Solirubrobacteraceae bacterium]
MPAGAARARRAPPRPAAPRGPAGRALVVAVIAVCLVAAVCASLALGSVKVPLGQVVDALFGWLTGNEARGVDREIILQLRLPRTVTAVAVGASLGVAGAMLQGSLGNPLASPDIVGVTGGAAFGAMLVILLSPGHVALLPLSALVFGMVAALLVLMISWTGANRGGVGRLILSGIAIGSVFTAATSMLMAIYPSRAPSAVMWLAGSLQTEGWPTIRSVAPYLAVGLVLAFALVRPLNRLALGDEVAASLGTSPRTVRLLAIVAAAILASGSAALAGLLGFLGIVIPHAVRLLGGTSNHTFVVPVSALAGATLLTAGDVVARTLKAPLELPVGPMMVAIGVPLFLWLLRRAV